MNDTIVINKLNTIYSHNEYDDNISTIDNDDIYYIRKEIEFNYLIYNKPFINNIFPKITQNDFKIFKYFIINKNKNKNLFKNKQNIRGRKLYKKK